MKNLKLLSLLATVIIIVAVSFNIADISNKKTPPANAKMIEEQKMINASYDSLNRIAQDIKSLNVPTPNNISQNLHNAQLNRIQARIQTHKKSTKLEFKKYETKMNKKAETEKKSMEITSLMKLIFSGIFTIAALFIVLSNKYGDDTKKWAFSILSLIAGVWIGTAT